MRKTRSAVVFSLALLFSAGLSVGAFAQDAPAEDEPRWLIHIGGFDADTDTRIRTSDPETGEGREISLEDDLGMDDNATTLRLKVAYAFGANRRHLIEFQYLQIDRSGRTVIDEEIEFGDDIYPINAEVRSDVRSEDFDLHYTYRIVDHEKGRLGISAGVHGIRLKSEASATFSIAGGEIAEVFEEESVDGQFPLPLIGIRGAYFLSSRFHLRAGVKLLDLKVGDVEGSFLDTWAHLDYVLSDTVSFGLGYSLISAEYDDEPDPMKASIVHGEYEYQGLELFLRLHL